MQKQDYQYKWKARVRHNSNNLNNEIHDLEVVSLAQGEYVHPKAVLSKWDMNMYPDTSRK
jgi:hypothetical protein